MYYKELIHPINNYNHSRKNEQSKANQTLVDLDFRVEGAVDEDKVNKNNNYEFLFVLMCEYLIRFLTCALVSKLR